MRERLQLQPVVPTTDTGEWVGGISHARRYTHLSSHNLHIFAAFDWDVRLVCSHNNYFAPHFD